ncbi:uncharacterized protein [Clytia hemisphaerica]|uniref:Potassium channel domain-containing protein n=1 Tax=Clytia hemisphaerica TaxID=252671 RepID=A0A7M5V415_9CNID
MILPHASIIFILSLMKLSGCDVTTSCQMRLLLGLPPCGPIKTPINTTYQFCNIPHPYLDDVKETMTCELLKKYNPTCNSNFSIAYSNAPPYIYKDANGNAHGMLINVLREILITRCCLSCNDLHILPEKEYTNKLINQFNKSTRDDIVAPIYSNSIATYRLPYTGLLKLTKISIIGEKSELSSENLMAHLIESVIFTWPLLLVALTLAICAGSVIWLLDTWVNKGQFPRRFPNGPFEGFWWAFVSMTTVGYGDRTPSSPAARIFAVLWILIGITIFNMYTAGLTSALSDQMMKKVTYDMHGKQIGVLTNVPNINQTIRTHYASPKGFDTLSKMKDALLNDNINGLAMESPMAKWFLSHYKEELNEKYDVLLTLEEEADSSIGISTFEERITKMVETFTSRTHAYQVTGLDDHLTIDSEDNYEETTPAFTPTHISFILTVVLALVISILVIILGHFINQYHQEKRKTLKAKECNLEMNGNNADDSISH